MSFLWTTTVTPFESSNESSSAIIAGIRPEASLRSAIDRSPAPREDDGAGADGIGGGICDDGARDDIGGGASDWRRLIGGPPGCEYPGAGPSAEGPAFIGPTLIGPTF